MSWEEVSKVSVQFDYVLKKKRKRKFDLGHPKSAEKIQPWSEAQTM